MKNSFSPQTVPIALKFFVALLLPGLLVGCSDPVFVFSGQDLPFNFYELDPGKAYRSAQPTGPQMKNAIDVLGLKTVINLRGSHPGVDWYDQEAEACRKAGVVLADYPMSSASLPPPDMLKGIVLSADGYKNELSGWHGFAYSLSRVFSGSIRSVLAETIWDSRLEIPDCFPVLTIAQRA